MARTKRNKGILGCGLTLATVVAACGGQTPQAKSPSLPATALAKAGAQCHVASTFIRISNGSGDDGMASAPIVLGTIEGKRVALVADEDEKAILTIDLDKKVEIARTPVGGTPSQLLATSDGRIYVTVRDQGRVLGFETTKADAALSARCVNETMVEPIAMTLDGGRLLTTDGWGQALAVLDSATLASKRTISVEKEPRAVLVPSGSRTAYVSHAAGGYLTVIDLDKEFDAVERVAAFPLGDRGVGPRAGSMKVARINVNNTGALNDQRPKASQGFALVAAKSLPGRLLVPQVSVDPGPIGERTSGYGSSQASAAEMASVGVFDQSKHRFLDASIRHQSDASIQFQPDVRFVGPCLLPRSAVVDEKTGSLLVSCLGLDAVIAYDASASNPVFAERNRWNVGAGPTGIALDDKSHVAVVWSQFDRTLSVFSLDAASGAVDTKEPEVARVAMKPLSKPLPAEFALGRILFHAAGDTRLASDGRACASCHPDGRDDAITWSTPDGPRRTILLAGRVGATAPYSWRGDEPTLEEHLGHTFKRLKGKGLRNLELAALSGYISGLPAPRRPKLDPSLVERGQRIFASEETGCASCHSGAQYTDGKVHDVHSKHAIDKTTGMHTPALTLVAGSGPYFHDGRYNSLKDLLRASDGTMGKTKHLSDNDLTALETYLKSL
ncbi:MAG: hypothetical protein U0174_03780 [Polyangiaceae bacterium]